MLLPQRTNRRAFGEAVEWASRIDEKLISDAAREWAENEMRSCESRSNAGEVMAMLEIAFEAGRVYQMRADVP